MAPWHLQRSLLVRVLCDGSGLFFFGVSALDVAGNREHMRCTTSEWLDFRVQTNTVCDVYVYISIYT